MTIDELYAHLCDEGYGASLRRYASGISLLDFDIERDGDVVRMCEKERGEIIHIYSETVDEAMACADYLDRVSCHIQRIFGHEDADLVARLQSQLAAAGIAVRQAALPEYLDLTDRFRLSVRGADLKRARDILWL